MAKNPVLECPSCTKGMNELPDFEGLWTCGACKKIWIEQFESDFKLTKPAKLKIFCPGCESPLMKARDEQGKDNFIFCGECGGIQLTIKQTDLFQSDELTNAIKKNFKKKPQKIPKKVEEPEEVLEEEIAEEAQEPEKKTRARRAKKTKEAKAPRAQKPEGAFLKIIRGYLYGVTFITTLLALLPTDFWTGLIGSGSLLQFSNIPYLGDFPLVLMGILIIFPILLISAKEMALARRILWGYMISMHFFLAYGLYPIVNLVDDFAYYRNVEIVDQNNDGIEDALAQYLDKQFRSGKLRPNELKAMQNASKIYQGIVELFYAEAHPFAHFYNSDFENSKMATFIQTFYDQFCGRRSIKTYKKQNFLRVINSNPRNKFLRDNLYLLPADVNSALAICN